MQVAVYPWLLDPFFDLDIVRCSEYCKDMDPNLRPCEKNDPRVIQFSFRQFFEI